MGAHRDWLIGSDPTCDVRFTEPTVSGKHCRLHLTNHKLVLEDLGSTNGTYVNGQRITAPTRVSGKDVITLGVQMSMPWPSIPPEEVRSELTIGADQDNDIVIDQPMISAHHARVLSDGVYTIIEDLGSTNGTHLGAAKVRVSRAPLRERDEVWLGSHSLPAVELFEAIERQRTSRRKAHKPFAIKRALEAPLATILSGRRGPVVTVGIASVVIIGLLVAILLRLPANMPVPIPTAVAVEAKPAAPADHGQSAEPITKVALEPPQAAVAPPNQQAERVPLGPPKLESDAPAAKHGNEGPPAISLDQVGSAIALICMEDVTDLGQRIFIPLTTAWAVDRRRFITEALSLACVLKKRGDSVTLIAVTSSKILPVQHIDFHPGFLRDKVLGAPATDQELQGNIRCGLALIEVPEDLPMCLELSDVADLSRLDKQGRPVTMLRPKLPEDAINLDFRCIPEAHATRLLHHSQETKYLKLRLPDAAATVAVLGEFPSVWRGAPLLDERARVVAVLFENSMSLPEDQRVQPYALCIDRVRELLAAIPLAVAAPAPKKSD